MAPLGFPGRNPHVGGNLDVVPAVDVPEGAPADVELEVLVGEVGLDARLAEAGHPVNLPQQVERVSGGVRGSGYGPGSETGVARTARGGPRGPRKPWLCP